MNEQIETAKEAFGHDSTIGELQVAISGYTGWEDFTLHYIPKISAYLPCAVAELNHT
jgi:hypothetical protein